MSKNKNKSKSKQPAPLKDLPQAEAGQIEAVKDPAPPAVTPAPVKEPPQVDVEQTAATGGVTVTGPATPRPSVYAFGTKSRCPRCGSTQTQATSTQGNIQYRQCQMPICRHKYSVFGKKI